MTARPEPDEHGAAASSDLAAVLHAMSPTSTSDELVRMVFDASPVAHVLLDLEGRIVLANAAYDALFGYRPGEMRGLKITDLTHPDDLDRSVSKLRSLVRGEVTRYELDKRYVRRDGSVLWARLAATVLRDREGRPWALFGAVEDITLRKEAESTAEENEARFRALVQYAADAIVVVDAHGRVTFATPSAELFTGSTIDASIGRSVLEWVHTDDRPVVTESFLNTSATPGPAVPLQLRIRAEDDTVRFIEVVATNLLDDPSVQGIVLNLRDLTAAKDVANALEMTETRFRHLVENISDTVTLIDGAGNVVLSTGNLRSILGFPTSFWETRNLFELVHPDDLARVQDSFVEILATPGKEMAGEARVRNADGDYIDAEINAVNLLEDPAVQGIVLTTRNITARKQHEVELAAARDQALRALEMRTEFIASVSHELRTPIHGVLGLAELLVTADLDDEARNLARSIGRATESLRMVLDDILDFSKIEVGRLEINPEPVRPIEIARDTYALFASQATAKGIELVMEEGDLPEWVLADGLRVRQVLNNLVGNAIKFTFAGEVRARAGRTTSRSGAEMIRVSVRDTGIGIDEAKYAQLFEPFSQAHKATREFGGTGLGLSIARRLTELMGGELGFASEVGRGSEFWFTVPLVEVAPPATRTARDRGAREEGAAAGSGRVLVVEDNPINQLLVRRQLERLGYEVELHDNGIAAIEAYADPAFDVDVVLMDWQLPGIDGLETTRRLRRWEQEHGREPTPIVAMTASALPGDRARCLEAGMDDFIAKPVSLTTLGQVVRRWVTRRPDTAAAWRSLPRHAASDDGGAAGGGAIDRSVLDGLIDELADPLLVVTVGRTYLRELGGRLDAIEQAVVDDDRTAVVAATHTLKSTSAAVGALSLSDLCLRLEQTARLSPGSALPVSPAQLREEAGRAHVELDRLLRGIAAQSPAPDPQPATGS